MAAITHNLAGLLAVTAQDRFDAMRSWQPESSLPDWFYPLLWTAIAMAGAAAAWLWLRKLHAGQVAFAEGAGRAGLTELERKALRNLAKLARLKDPVGIFTSPEAFQAGQERLLSGRSMRNAPPVVLEGTARFLEGLRDKMKYVVIDEHPREAGHDTQKIEPGTAVTIQTAKGAMISALLLHNQANGLEIEIEGAVALTPGQTLTARFQDANSMWEFPTTVLAAAGGRATLAHTHQLRFLSRRRYPRFHIRRQARIAAFPFVVSSGGWQTPEFLPAELTEMAGPGMRFRSALRPKVHDRVLALIYFSEGQTVCGVGVVRRVLLDQADASVFAVELTGLGRNDLAALVRETNQASHEAMTDERPLSLPSNANIARAQHG